MINLISRRSRNRFPLPLKIVSIIAIAFVTLHFIAPQALSSFFTMIVRPFWNIEQTIRHGDTPMDEFRVAVKTAEENFAKNDAVQKENDDLKFLLGRTKVSHLVVSTILKKPPFSAYDSFILDIGNDKGAQKGNKVFALGNIPVGEIAEVNGNTSKVRLYSSSGEKFDVLIGKNNISAVAIGKGGGYFEASLPRDTGIVKGDAVMIPALSDAFVGTVEDIIAEPSNPFSKILFHQPVNIYELRWVLVDVAP